MKLTLPGDSEIARLQEVASDFSERFSIANSLNTNEANSSTSQIKPRYLRYLRGIGDVLTVTREIKIYSVRFFVSFLFASPKVSLVFSATWRVPPRVSTAHSFINPGTLSLPFRPYQLVCMWQGFLKTAFVCGSTPCTRRVRPFASWEIGVKILDSTLTPLQWQ